MKGRIRGHGVVVCLLTNAVEWQKSEKVNNNNRARRVQPHVIFERMGSASCKNGFGDGRALLFENRLGGGRAANK